MTCNLSTLRMTILTLNSWFAREFFFFGNSLFDICSTFLLFFYSISNHIISDAQWNTSLKQNITSTHITLPLLFFLLFFFLTFFLLSYLPLYFLSFFINFLPSFLVLFLFLFLIFFFPFFSLTFSSLISAQRRTFS